MIRPPYRALRALGISRAALFSAALLAGGACGRDRPPDADGLRRIADDVAPAVERAVGLPFRAPPLVLVRTRDQVRDFLEAKLHHEYPPEEIARITLAYRLFHLWPDTLDLGELLIELLTEQVVGYYDPDSLALYVVQGADPLQVRLILAHELVHALQDQYMRLDSILALRGDNDRKMAAQAVLEGQATLASLRVMAPGQDLTSRAFWDQMREGIRREQARMPVFNAAPLVLREGLVFPYIAGAEFMHWFETNHPDTVPFGARMPESTEQILHPERYRRGDRPVDLAFTGGPEPHHTDVLGSFEVRLLLWELSGNEFVGTAAAVDWGGDRYGVFVNVADTALVWYSVWDTEAAANRFRTILEREWVKHPRPGRRFTVERLPVNDHPGVRLVDAPGTWEGWGSVPGVSGER